MPSTLINRNVVSAGHRTSVRLEPEFWSVLEEIARAEDMPMNAMVARAGSSSRGLTTSVRVFALEWFKSRASNSTRDRAGDLPAG